MKHRPGYTLRLLSLIFLIFPFRSPAQSTTGDPFMKGRGDIRFMFYNVENLFDCENDPLTDDDAFLPEGDMHWTVYRFRQKIHSVFRVIAAAGGWIPPEIICLCEVENRRVISELTGNTPLRKYAYQSIHRDSPDPRGMDLAVLYNPSFMNPVDSFFFNPAQAGFSPDDTRDILYVKFALLSGDTIQVLCNHWPSRFSGLLETSGKRQLLSQYLGQILDSLSLRPGQDKYIVAGDFNDSDTDASMRILTGRRFRDPGFPDFSLVNASVATMNKQIHGSHKYQGVWYDFDKVLVSENLLGKGSGVFTTIQSGFVFAPAFLLQEDVQQLGWKPFRTYSGPRYLGGYSDHLPVILDLYLDK